MKFLVDAQLPASLADALNTAGHNAIHTSKLPNGNRTKDAEITRLSTEQERIVVTKDADFADSFLLHREPYKLLIVSTGNISNRKLLDLFRRNLDAMLKAFTDAFFIEISKNGILVHE